MTDFFYVYSLGKCPFCVAALTALDRAGFDYVLIMLDKAIDYHMHLAKKYDHGSVPIVVRANKISLEEEFIGGCEQLIIWIEENGYA